MVIGGLGVGAASSACIIFFHFHELFGKYDRLAPSLPELAPCMENPGTATGGNNINS